MLRFKIDYNIYVIFLVVLLEIKSHIFLKKERKITLVKKEEEEYVPWYNRKE